ncbi:MAG TPA: sigma-70 family RNA polymerase sigma factor, partial [Clostridia bacterium]
MTSIATFKKLKSTKSPYLRHEIIKENMDLVHKICHKYKHCTLEPYEDLAQVGMAALCAVVDKFDPDLGYQFSTLAYLRIEGDIKNHLMNRTTTIRFPRKH